MVTMVMTTNSHIQPIRMCDVGIKPIKWLLIRLLLITILQQMLFFESIFSCKYSFLVQTKTKKMDYKLIAHFNYLNYAFLILQ